MNNAITYYDFQLLHSVNNITKVTILKNRQTGEVNIAVHLSTLDKSQWLFNDNKTIIVNFKDFDNAINEVNILNFPLHKIVIAYDD